MQWETGTNAVARRQARGIGRILAQDMRPGDEVFLSDDDGVTHISTVTGIRGVDTRVLFYAGERLHVLDQLDHLVLYALAGGNPKWMDGAKRAEDARETLKGDDMILEEDMEDKILAPVYGTASVYGDRIDGVMKRDSLAEAQEFVEVMRAADVPHYRVVEIRVIE